MDLILLVCLVASPDSCREERILVSYERSNPRSCMVGAAPVMAEWAGGNPDWQISRWKCGRTSDSKLTRNFD